MERTTARTRVVDYLATIPRRGKDRWVIADDQTIDHDLFWMFFWTTSRAFWPRRRSIPMTGNYPIAVAKDDGSVFVWTMLYPFEEFAERIRDRRDQLPRLR
jgi:hypothetical protein